jgi:hypothetical protein
VSRPTDPVSSHATVLSEIVAADAASDSQSNRKRRRWFTVDGSWPAATLQRRGPAAPESTLLILTLRGNALGAPSR